MPDLRPDVGNIFTKPAPMNIGDLVNTARGIAIFKGQQGVSDLMKQNIDPITQDPDMGAVSSQLHTIDGIVTPDVVAGIENARQAQLASRGRELEALTRIMGPLADKPNLSEDDIQDARTRVAGVYGGGKRGQMIADRILGVGTKNEVRTPAAFRQRMTEIQAGQGMLPPMGTRPGPGGVDVPVPLQRIVGESREQAAGGRGAVAGAVPEQPPQPEPTLQNKQMHDVPLGGPQLTATDPEAKKAYRDQVLRSQQVYPEDIATLETGIKSLAQLGPRGTAEPAGVLTGLNKFLYNAGIISSPGQAVNYEEARKQMAAWIAKQPMAGNSVEHLVTVAGGSPGMGLQQQTNETLMKMALSIRRMQYAGLKRFQEQGGNYNQWDDWRARWGGKQDYVAYGWDTYTDQQRRDYIAKLGPKNGEQYRNFMRSLNTAKHFGLEKPGRDWNYEDIPKSE